MYQQAIEVTLHLYDLTKEKTYLENKNWTLGPFRKLDSYNPIMEPRSFNLFGCRRLRCLL